MKSPRKQLSLFCPPPKSVELETIRKKIDPIQSEKISAHITLCYEDEIEDWTVLMERLEKVNDINIKVLFGRPKQMFGGIMIPQNEVSSDYQKLRSNLLHGFQTIRNNVNPHITLLHPKNVTCIETAWNEVQQTKNLGEMTFNEICIIEQTKNNPWVILKKYT